MNNIINPRTVSFEEALRNLASRLTGKSPAALPRTQEAIVQYMAENIPSLDELGEAITQEVIARLQAADEPPAEGAEGPSTASGTPDDTQDPQEPESATEAAGAAKTGRSRKTTKTKN